jgi:cell division protease FtsH
MTADPGEATPLSTGDGSMRTTERQSRQRDEDRLTRKPLGLWDRIRLILLFAGAWAVLFWAALAQFDPQISTQEAANQTLRSYWWVLALAGLELLRQIHYLISERSARYHRFWNQAFTRKDKRLSRMNDWTRFRIGRVGKILFILAIIDLALAKIYHLPPATALIQLPIAVFQALPFVWQLAFSFFFIVFQFVGLFWFLSRGGIDVYMPDDIKTRFGDVWGQDRVLDRVKENIIFLEDPESIEEKGGYVPGGILLWGPPGTGKTLMAEAVAGETGRPFVFVDPGAFIQMFFGVGILKVKGLFRKLRRLALRYGGVIVFFDEADSLGNRGAPQQPGPFGMDAGGDALWQPAPSCNGLSYVPPETVAMLMRDSLPSTVPDEDGPRLRKIIAGMGMGGGGMGTLQALLTELSGLKKPRGFVNRVVRRVLGMRPKPPPKYRILVMMATNMPQALDEALLRPGRIDRIYKVGYPSKAGRIRTFEGYLAKVKHDLTPDDVDRLATVSPYATGASIKDMVNEALINAIRSGRDVIAWQDIQKAKHLKELGPPEDVEYIDRERHAIAVHEACHAVIGTLRERWYIIDIATIEKGGDYLGMVKPIPPEDQHTKWRSHYESEIMTFLASLAGEKLFFGGDSSSGVLGDLEAATSIAVAMEGYWGMGATVASHRVTRRLGAGPGGPPPDEENLLKGTLGTRIEAKLRSLLDETRNILEENRASVLAVAYALETHKTISGEDVAAIVEGRSGPLIDGRPYHDPAFAARLEAYHTHAVQAHEAHGRVAVKFPGLEATGDLDGKKAGAHVAAEAAGNGEVLDQEADEGGNGQPRTIPPRPDEGEAEPVPTSD